MNAKKHRRKRQPKPKLLIKKLRERAMLPRPAHPGDAGLDLFSCEELTIDPGQARLVRTGIAIQLPHDTEAQVRPRSGLALNFNVTVLNAPGTIDEGYRGEVGVILINHGKDTFRIKPGMKIAQLVVQPVYSVAVEETDEIDRSDRGKNGFGSTGI